MLDAALGNMKLRGRVTVCGMISQYNLETVQGMRNFVLVISKCIRLQGFTVLQYGHLYREFEEKVVKHVREGSIEYLEDVAEGLDSRSGACVIRGPFRGPEHWQKAGGCCTRVILITACVCYE
ncbi:hypothetical protein ZIOFF_049632 [Zingiber officinale]|uniref:Uncharacterized protein n=1 Tax=Zingiber officinale TaxID=94328 RepID=A0A8J5KQ20_ZINOF|nr:hypothetical protein ZIOFF_049632 [Zingiber officinale]